MRSHGLLLQVKLVAPAIINIIVHSGKDDGVYCSKQI